MFLGALVFDASDDDDFFGDCHGSITGVSADLVAEETAHRPRPFGVSRVTTSETCVIQ